MGEAGLCRPPHRVRGLPIYLLTLGVPMWEALLTTALCVPILVAFGYLIAYPLCRLNWLLHDRGWIPKRVELSGVRRGGLWIGFCFGLIPLVTELAKRVF